MSCKLCNIFETFITGHSLVSVGHLCILPERFAKKDLNRKFGHRF